MDLDDRYLSPTIAGGVLGFCGLLFVSVHFWHLVSHDEPFLAQFFGAIIPLGIASGIVYAGYWLRSQDFEPRYATRLLCWALAGGVLVAAVLSFVHLHFVLSGTHPIQPVYQTVTVATAGTIGGIFVGLYEVRSRRQAALVTALQDASTDLMDAPTREDVCAVVVDIAASVLGLSITGAWLYDEETGVLRPTASSAAGDALFVDPPVYEPGNSLSWTVYDSGEPLLIDDLRNSCGAYNRDTPIRSEMIFPLGDHGVLNMGRLEPNAFSALERTVAGILATSATAVLDRADREEALRTHRAQLAEQTTELERQNDRLEQFARTLTHDLRNPLNVASATLREAMDSNDLSKLEDTEWAIDRMMDLTADGLALAKQGRTVSDPEPVRLRAVIDDAWAIVATQDATLDVTVDDETVLADARRLRAIFENLFRNAIVHGGPSTTVSVGLLENGDGIYVADDGPGIPKSEREKIFHSDYTTSDEGTGFGLAIVREAAAAHGWSVTATESDAGGARFDVAFVA